MDCHNKQGTFPYSGVTGDIIRYGQKLREPILKEAVLYFYKNS